MTEEYDVIVVGGGSAGCPLAARLSEDGWTRVLLVEAGPDSRDWRIRMPLAVDRLLNGTAYNWAYTSEHEAGLGRAVPQPRGRVLGGSSAINGMVYTRPNPQDFEAWRDRFGCTGWGYADVLPYFRRMEAAPWGDPRYRGHKGPLRVTRPDARNPLNRAFLEAGRALGYPMSDDLNGAQHEGFGISEQSIVNGQRNASAFAWLTPEVRRRANLTIVTGALAEGILTEGRRATGLRYSVNGQPQEVRAREVVLAAGGIGSPQLLMLSGIGPGPQLSALGLPVVADLPGVGQNLQDHPDLAIQFACREAVTLRRAALWPRKALVGLEWFLRHTGIAASNQFEVAAYIRTRAGLSQPNLKLEFFPLALDHKTYAPYPQEAFQIHMTIQDSPTRGTLSLHSADPKAAPILRFNYLSDPADMATFKEAIRLTRELVDAAPFARYRGIELEPGEAASSESSLEDWIRSRVTTAYHVSCTARMGSASDPLTVVGPDLRVHGIEGLRVADASVMPQVVSANTNATCMMIGERAADLILGKALAPDPAPFWVHPSWQTEQR
ncbi:choline dehydrogenase [Albidovulum sp.]|uniref:choline dehydrogenase n=1 Tax=Albidovulum sp. TaxID=1872424 RepID=UPI0039B91029